ncbi:acyltransferase ChoActase/COT/CPT [Gaertneriomyces semiglobifer]|nr:acyltransferase ChoActase/COT/CPT [Gaertneriomyces semiglobifer]
MTIFCPSRSRLLGHSRRYLATQASTKTFGNQSKVPRLPVPSLKNLADKYLASCSPLLSPEEYNRTEAAVQEFIKPGGFGEELQKRLLDYDKTQENSWLEHIWLNKAYLEWREPSLINVNWWCQFVDHPEHPQDLLSKPPPKGVLSSFQIHRAAGLITNMLNFKEVVDSERLAPEYLRDKPLDMNQYKNQFGATRISASPADKIHTVWPASARHIIVLTRDQIYKVDVVRSDGSRVPIQEIERILYAVGQDSLSKQPQPAVGVLTAGDRDTCAKGMDKLRQLSQQNTQNLEIIKDALFAVCLDAHSTKKNIDLSHHQIFHNFNGHNRWFDKAIQLVVTSSGRSGVNGEHTPSDAVIPGKMFDFILSTEPAVDPPNSDGPALPAPQRLEWVVDEEVTALVREAETTAKALIKDTQSCLLQTDIYGARYIKEVAGASPDAYVQLALQLAWRRMPADGGHYTEPNNEPTAVYESASTRLFKHGRTETGRSLTKETWEFACAFDNDNILYDDKRSIFRKALAAQSAYMKDATFGKGIDRHMLGLRCMIKPEEQGKAEIFNDAAFTKSMTFRLSSSNMSPGTWFYGGFGPVVPNGYGINYAIGKDSLKFSISSKLSCKETDSFRYRDTLERTLKDMMILFPKRSEVWGMNWKEQHAQEKKEAAYLKTMKKLSNEYVAKKELIAQKYAPKTKEN